MQNCHTCQKSAPVRRTDRFRKLFHVNQPNQEVCCDLMGPKREHKTLKYIIIILNTSTRNANNHYVDSHNANAVIKVVFDWIEFYYSMETFFSTQEDGFSQKCFASGYKTRDTNKSTSIHMTIAWMGWSKYSIEPFN